jgi:hypothetical protein
VWLIGSGLLLLILWRPLRRSLLLDKLVKPSPIRPNDFPLGDRMQDDER